VKEPGPNQSPNYVAAPSADLEFIILRNSLTQLDAVRRGEVDSIEVFGVEGMIKIEKDGVKSQKRELKKAWGKKYPQLFRPAIIRALTRR
jgi:hypothetical protein